MFLVESDAQRVGSKGSIILRNLRRQGDDHLKRVDSAIQAVIISGALGAITECATTRLRPFCLA